MQKGWRDMKKCVKCGEITQDASLYCAECGSNRFDHVDDLICPKCGRANPKGYAYCNECGTALGEKPVSAPRQELQRVVTVYQGQRDMATSDLDLAMAENECTTCPTCGATLPLNSMFCTNCGTSIASLTEHRHVKRKICSICGSPNMVEAQFCSYCFASLMDAPMEDFELVHEMKQIGDKVYKEAFLQNGSNKSKICVNCGSVNEMDESYCVKCGYKLDMETQYRYCTKCGAENDSEAQYCAQCQYPFDGNDVNEIGRIWICKTCNYRNNDNSKFCAHCGAPRQK